MQRELAELIRHRASFRCEYCHFTDRFSGLNFQIDHIIAEKHGGLTESENLAFSCIYCNSYKGANLSGIDPVTREIVRLFHPLRPPGVPRPTHRGQQQSQGTLSPEFLRGHF